MYGDWRDNPVVNHRGTKVMFNCRTINPRTKLARVVRYLRASERSVDALIAVARLSNHIYAEKAVRDLR